MRLSALAVSFALTLFLVGNLARAADMATPPAADMATTPAADMTAPSCPAGQLLCGTQHCAAVGTVCCAAVGHEEISCPAGTVCKADGSCGSTCAAGQSTTLASCGGDTCGCSSPCVHHKDCKSTCCSSGGFCAPLCVCQGQGLLYTSCDKSGTGYPALVSRGCSLLPGAPGGGEGGVLAVVLLLALLGLATGGRRRASQSG